MKRYYSTLYPAAQRCIDINQRDLKWQQAVKPVAIAFFSDNIVPGKLKLNDKSFHKHRIKEA